jgi:hypothetical protein
VLLVSDYGGGMRSHTVQLAQPALFAELARGDAEAVIFNDACAARKVNRSLDPGGLGVERVVEELEHHAGQRHNGRRRLDLGDDIWRQRQNGRCVCHAGADNSVCLWRP